MGQTLLVRHRTSGTKTKVPRSLKHAPPGFSSILAAAGLVRFRLRRVEQILDLVDSPASVTITDFYESLRIGRCE